ncbi:transmembrane protein 126A-like [Amphiura filiformis]|uniref:transmembrane protein 126A-like n=1 Tax=Amphiura filiformis TaxID=82378 RepID=UPI003B21BB5E
METNEAQKSPPAAPTYGQYGSLEHQRHRAQYITRSEVINEQTRIVDALPMSKRWPFEAGGTYVPIYAGISGLIVNSFLRRMLMIHSRPLMTALPMALLPGLTMKIGWYGFVTMPVLAGDLNCAICGEMRGGLVSVALGAVYPMIIGLPFFSAVAQGNHKVQVPKLTMAVTNWAKFSQFWTRKLRFFKVQFVSLVIFQAVIGSFVAKKQMDVMETEVLTKFTKVQVPDEED